MTSGVITDICRFFTQQRAAELAITEEAFLSDCWERGVCPFCRKVFPPTERIGSGQKARGGFCSLTCYTKYYELDIVERQKIILGGGRDSEK